MYFCCGSLENAMSHAEPEPSVRFAMNASFTKVPSGLNTWIRSFTRSQTYNKRSTERSAQCTGLRNCWAGGASAMAFILAGFRVEHNHAVIAVPVGDINFIRLFVDEGLRRQAQVLDII